MSANESKKYYSDEDIDRLGQMLDAKSEEGTKKMSKKEVLLRLQPKIRQMLDSGFTLAEICSFFAEAGFPVSKPTIHAAIAGISKSGKSNSKKGKSLEKSEKATAKKAKPEATATPKPEVTPEVTPEVKPVVRPQPVERYDPESDFNDPDA